MHLKFTFTLRRTSRGSLACSEFMRFKYQLHLFVESSDSGHGQHSLSHSLLLWKLQRESLFQGRVRWCGAGVPLKRHHSHHGIIVLLSLVIPPFFPSPYTDYFMILLLFCVLVARRAAQPFSINRSFMNISCRKLNAFFLRTRRNVM